MKSLAVCLAVYNRRATTLACLAALFGPASPTDVPLTVYLLDDASTDGTAEAVAQTFPQVRILNGTGDCYWSGGMRRAFGAALSQDHDVYVWLNDDVELFDGALDRLLLWHVRLAKSTGGLHLLGGAVRNAEGVLSYGGRVRDSILPWKMRIQPVNMENPTRCDVLNGNLLLIPAAVARRIGNIDPAFQHALGDFDYSLRAARSSVQLWIAPGYLGSCEINTARLAWMAPNLTLAERFRKMETPLGAPLRELWAYSRRHFPLWSPFYTINPYARMVVRHLLSKMWAPFRRNIGGST